MSRSFRKTKIFPIALPRSSGLMRWFKDYHSGCERRMVREKLSRLDFELLEFEQCPWNEWSTPRDGKTYWEEATKKDMRK